ncbi:Dabb family protein [Arcticibacter sp. MXS-1]|uniref:Dabb family protein n=1 Tax=Arcticibacter sp. MXS-1 TaxID=3341726 RepID=UPI0035A8921E
MRKTNRRRFLTSAATIVAGTTAASAVPFSSIRVKNPVAHHVFFWLKNPSSEEDRNRLIAGLKTLAKIPTVKELRVGVIASTEKREVVDTTWSVSELMFFEDLQGQATYQSHPIHQEFIKNCSHLWEKVVVYDSLDV